MMVNNFNHVLSKHEIKLAINTAAISQRPDDEFSLVGCSMNYNEFTCELCGHKHCIKELIIKNNTTNKTMSVGSECIGRFADKGVNIDIAEGLIRRVTSASNKARRDLKRKLGYEAFYALPEEERATVKPWDIRDRADELGKEAYKKLDRKVKQELVVNEYLILQTKELLTNVAYRNSILTEKDIELILQLDMQEDMDKALVTKERMAKQN